MESYIKSRLELFVPHIFQFIVHLNVQTVSKNNRGQKATKGDWKKAPHILNLKNIAPRINKTYLTLTLWVRSIIAWLTLQRKHESRSSQKTLIFFCLGKLNNVKDYKSLYTLVLFV